MNKKKIFIIAGIFLSIWIFLISIFYKEKLQLSKEEIPQFLVIDSNFFWKYEDGKWNDLYIKEEFDLFNWKKFDIFIDNNYVNTYEYVFNNYQPYFFADDLTSQEVSGSYMLINKNSYFNVVNYKEDNFNDDDVKIADRFLKKYKKDYNDITYKYKYLVSDNFSVYVLSNYTDSIYVDDIYYFVFARINNRNYFIADGDYNKNFSLYTVLDVGKKYPNIVLKYSIMNFDTYAYDMYQYDDGKYNKVIGLEEDE